MAPRRRRDPAGVTTPQQGHQSVEVLTTDTAITVHGGWDGGWDGDGGAP